MINTVQIIIAGARNRIDIVRSLGFILFLTTALFFPLAMFLPLCRFSCEQREAFCAPPLFRFSCEHNHDPVLKAASGFIRMQPSYQQCHFLHPEQQSRSQVPGENCGSYPLPRYLMNSWEVQVLTPGSPP